MELGTIIKMADGRIGTVVFNGLEGTGVKWGRHSPNPEDFKGTSGGLFGGPPPEEWPWFPDAILRDPWPSCERVGWKAEQCVGEGYMVEVQP